MGLSVGIGSDRTCTRLGLGSLLKTTGQMPMLVQGAGARGMLKLWLIIRYWGRKCQSQAQQAR